MDNHVVDTLVRQSKYRKFTTPEQRELAILESVDTVEKMDAFMDREECIRKVGDKLPLEIRRQGAEARRIHAIEFIEKANNTDI